MAQTRKVTIVSGQSLSAAIACQGGDLIGIQMSGGWDAAGLSFQVGLDSTTGTFQEAFDDAGAALAVSAGAARYIAVGNTLLKSLRGVRFLKVRSGTSGAPVNQTADRVLTLLFSN